MCWYDPSEETKRYLKQRCVEIVDEIKRLEKEGDPIDCRLSDMKTLLDHLYHGNCDEKPPEDTE